MKIGLFGDSFTCSSDESSHFAWYNLLAEKLDSTIHNFEYNCTERGYGLGGTSTFWSYKKFLKFYDKHDFIFFVAGDCLKYPKMVKIFKNSEYEKPITGITDIEWFSKNENVSDDGKDILEKIKIWYLISDTEHLEVTQNLILEDIERRTDSKLLLLAGDNKTAFTEARQTFCQVPFGMWDFTRVIHESLGLHENKWGIIENERPDKIAAHMTEPANRLFADMMYDMITLNKKPKLPSYIHHDFDYTYYYGK